MDAEQLLDAAAAIAAEMPEAVFDMPFGPDWEVYRVSGKMFILLTAARGPARVNLKVDPGESLALQAVHPEITPGYHMSKRHWISVTPGETVDREVLAELISDSYVLVVAGLSKREQQRLAMVSGR